MDDNNINQRIIELCNERNWSKYKLAKESGIQTSTVSSMLNNDHVPSFHTLSKICGAFQISLSGFFQSELFSDFGTPLYKKLWNDLSIKDKEKVLIYMHGLLHKQIKDGEI
nr:MAG TPA: hypothetical protein [Caudoviricetes sp.]